MNSEVEQLREEIAKLRERVAVLEAAPKHMPPPMFIRSPAAPSWFEQNKITCWGDGRDIPLEGKPV